MKLYDFSGAPSPRRVRIFLAEKGVTVPTEQVDLRKREHFAESFRRINPNCVVPALELDDGTCLCESVAICRYFEELYSQPALFGTDPADKARVEMWNRRVELEGYLAVADVLRNTLPAFEDRGLPGVTGVPQIPALAERGRATVARLFLKLDAQLASNEFVAGARYSVADITALVTMDFGARLKVELPDGLENLKRWYRAVSSRPSATA